jgi:hypothetical protein
MGRKIMLRTRRWLFAAGLVASVLGAARLATAQQFDDPPLAAAGSESEVETMLRGPIHESFAQPVPVNPEPGMIAPQPPPEPIEELPPEVRPVGEDAVWIPGYWAWEPAREDFLWISGVWRVPPPDRRWVSGYWTEAQDGYQWLSGFWAPLEDPQVQYLPEPPQSIEEGPTSPAPSEQYFWVNGCWIYQRGGYAWRPGYWAPFYEGWVWVPAHYVWTPRGCIFVDGYWDYPVVRRGQCFAPVYFRDVVYRQPRYVYTPRVAINLQYLLIHLFVNPRSNHYYCGNYYDNRYQQIGFYPWSSVARQPRYYDPLFSYYSTFFQNRGVNYAERLQGWHRYYERNEGFRPPVTLREQVQLASRAETSDFVRYSLLGQRVEQLLEGRDAEARFERVAEDQRRELAQSRSALREVIEARKRVEAQASVEDIRERSGEGRPEARAPVTVQLPETPELSDRRPGRGAERRPEVGDERTKRDPVTPGEGRERPPREADEAPPPRPDRGPGRPDRDTGRPESRLPEDRPDGLSPEESPGNRPGKPLQRPAAPPDRPQTDPGQPGEEARGRPDVGRPGEQPSEERRALRPPFGQPDQDRGRPTPKVDPGEERSPRLPDGREGTRPTLPPGAVQEPPRGIDRDVRDPRLIPRDERGGRDERLTPQVPTPSDRRPTPSPRGEERKAPPTTIPDERLTPQAPSPADRRLTPSPRGEERKAPPAFTPGRSSQQPSERERPSSRPFPGSFPFDRGYRPEVPEVERGRSPESRPSQPRPETQPRPQVQPRFPSDPFGGRSPRVEAPSPDRGRSELPEMRSPSSRPPQVERSAPRVEAPSAQRGRSFEPPARSRGGSERPDKPSKNDREKGKGKSKD